jgi:hypothetical protein
VVVDAMLNAAEGAEFEVVASTVAIGRDAMAPAVGDRLPVQRASDGTAFVSIPDLPPGEVLVLVNRS